MSELAERLDQVHSRINSATAAANRSSTDIKLIVVTKNHPAQLVLDLLSLGEQNFGENRDQEASAKAQLVASHHPLMQPVWHFVGQLQSNKVKSVLQYSSVLHSLDRESLLTELIKQLAKAPHHKLGVFIELNLTEDQARGGVLEQDLLGFAEKVLLADQLELLGVMGVAGLDVAPEADFERIALASQRLRTLAPQARYISAGMSADFEQAIAFGATHIRVGTAITGKR